VRLAGLDLFQTGRWIVVARGVIRVDVIVGVGGEALHQPRFHELVLLDKHASKSIERKALSTPVLNGLINLKRLFEPLFGARQITLFLKNTSEVAESGRGPALIAHFIESL